MEGRSLDFLFLSFFRNSPPLVFYKAGTQPPIALRPLSLPKFFFFFFDRIRMSFLFSPPLSPSLGSWWFSYFPFYGEICRKMLRFPFLLVDLPILMNFSVTRLRRRPTEPKAPVLPLKGLLSPRFEKVPPPPVLFSSPRNVISGSDPFGVPLPIISIHRFLHDP